MNEINMMKDFLVLLSVYLFLFPLELMKERKIRNALVLLGAFFVFGIWNFCYKPDVQSLLQIFVVRMFVVFVAVWIIYGKMRWRVVYCSVWSIMIFNSVDTIWEILLRITPLAQQKLWVQMICQLILFTAAYTALEMTLIRWIPRNGKYQVGPRRTISAVLILLLSQYSYYNYYMTNGQSKLAIMVQLYCVTFLYLQAELFKKSEMNEELAMMQRLWFQQKKQYEIAKDQMQLIDRKCHDLKYQVAAMRHIENKEEREKNLKELEKSIRIYDSIVKTGNDILDTLLSEKSLICEARGITMQCVIDGSRLSYLDPIDIYALFGNAIDNAMECVEKFKEPQMKFIDVCVTEKQNFVYIRISNPIQRIPEYEDGLPKTTKKNKKYHGLGLKSIKSIAEKYSGEISVQTEMDCFILEILLPAKK